METEEERIQRLIKEGLTKAKADEELETRKQRENINAQTGKMIGGVFLMVFITLILAAIIAAFVFNTNNHDNYAGSEPVQTRADIFETVNSLKHACKNSGSYNDCQRYLDYIRANRDVLDSGTIPNWASDTIPKVEKQIEKVSKTPTKTSSVTPNPTNRPFDYCGGKSGSDLERCLSSSYDNDELTALYQDCALHATDISTLAKVQHARYVCGVGIRRLTSGTVVTYGGFDTEQMKQSLMYIDAQLSDIEKVYKSASQ